MQAGIQGFVDKRGMVLCTNPIYWYKTRQAYGQRTGHFFPFSWMVGPDTKPNVLPPTDLAPGDMKKEVEDRMEQAFDALVAKYKGFDELFELLKPSWESHENFWLRPGDDPDNLPLTIHGDLIVEQGADEVREINKVTLMHGNIINFGVGKIVMERLFSIHSDIELFGDATLELPRVITLRGVNLFGQSRLIAKGLAHIRGSLVMDHAVNLVADELMEVSEDLKTFIGDGCFKSLVSVGRELDVRGGAVTANKLENVMGRVCIRVEATLNAKSLKHVGRLEMVDRAVLHAPLLEDVTPGGVAVVGTTVDLPSLTTMSNDRYESLRVVDGAKMTAPKLKELLCRVVIAQSHLKVVSLQETGPLEIYGSLEDTPQVHLTAPVLERILGPAKLNGTAVRLDALRLIMGDVQTDHAIVVALALRVIMGKADVENGSVVNVPVLVLADGGNGKQYSPAVSKDSTWIAPLLKAKE